MEKKKTSHYKYYLNYKVYIKKKMKRSLFYQQFQTLILITGFSDKKFLLKCGKIHAKTDHP